MKIEVEEKKLQTIIKTYHFKINLNDEMYFFIVEHFYHEKEVVIEIKRGTTYWDCQKRLTASEKKLVKRTIERMF